MGDNYMITNEDLKRLTGDEQVKKHRLTNLAKACADANTDKMKAMWYNKLMDLANQYNLKDWVMRSLIH
jgi:hypothetical protein